MSPSSTSRLLIAVVCAGALLAACGGRQTTIDNRRFMCVEVSPATLLAILSEEAKQREQQQSPTVRARLPEPVRDVVEPAIALPHHMTRISGDIPNTSRMNLSKWRDNEMRISAKLCTDTEGRVTSARVYTELPHDTRDAVLTALRSWQYEPYRVDGEPRPACFGATFVLQAKGELQDHYTPFGIGPRVNRRGSGFLREYF